MNRPGVNHKRGETSGIHYIIQQNASFLGLKRVVHACLGVAMTWVTFIELGIGITTSLSEFQNSLLFWFYDCLKLAGFFPTKDMQTSPLPSVLNRFSWMMWNLLNRTKKRNKKISVFIFRVILKNSSKNKIGKIWNLVFLSIQLIPDLSCKFDHLWKKIYILLKKIPCMMESNLFSSDPNLT